MDDSDQCPRIAILLNRFRKIKSLTIVGRHRLSDTDLIHLEICGSSLRALDLRQCLNITDHGFLNIVSARFLSVIRLTSTEIKDYALEYLAKYCPKLTRVDISCSAFITDLGILYLLCSFEKLLSLDITVCDAITGTAFKECPPDTLSFLRAGLCNFIPEGTLSILRSNIEHLNMSRNLNLHLLDQDVLAKSGIALRLRVLDLSTIESVGDKAIKVISKECPLLQSWNLSRCSNIGIPGSNSISVNCKNLQVLYEIECRGLCALGLQSLRDGCIQLQILYTGGKLDSLFQLASQVFVLRKNVELSDEVIWDPFPMECFFELEEEEMS